MNRAHAAPQGVCENLTDALEVLANQKRMETALHRVLLQTSVKGRLEVLQDTEAEM